MKVPLFIKFCTIFLGIRAFSNEQSNDSKNGARIVGGNATTVEKFPYIAQLYHANNFCCGACIISSKWVLTAGHCIYGQGINNVTLRVGVSKINETTDEPIITLAEINLHPQFNDTTVDYDISILLLNETLVFGNKIGSIQLPPPNVVLPAGTLATIVGWGSLSYLGPAPTQLQEVTVPVITNVECARLYENSTEVYVTDRNICAGYEEGGKDACNGDSGGPFVVHGILYGLVSSGQACADERYPGTYTNISSVRSYIKEVTGL